MQRAQCRCHRRQETGRGAQSDVRALRCLVWSDQVRARPPRRFPWREARSTLVQGRSTRDHLPRLPTRGPGFRCLEVEGREPRESSSGERVAAASASRLATSSATASAVVNRRSPIRYVRSSPLPTSSYPLVAPMLRSSNAFRIGIVVGACVAIALNFQRSAKPSVHTRTRARNPPYFFFLDIRRCIWGRETTGNSSKAVCLAILMTSRCSPYQLSTCRGVPSSPISWRAFDTLSNA